MSFWLLSVILSHNAGELRSRNKIIRAITTTARIRRILTDSLSVPKIIGIGPMSIIPALFVFRGDLATDIAIDRKTIATPIMTIIAPARLSEDQSSNAFACLGTEKSKQLKFKLKVMLVPDQ